MSDGSKTGAETETATAPGVTVQLKLEKNILRVCSPNTAKEQGESVDEAVKLEDLVGVGSKESPRIGERAATEKLKKLGESLGGVLAGETLETLRRFGARGEPVVVDLRTLRDPTKEDWAIGVPWELSLSHPLDEQPSLLRTWYCVQETPEEDQTASRTATEAERPQVAAALVPSAVVDPGEEKDIPKLVEVSRFRGDGRLRVLLVQFAPTEGDLRLRREREAVRDLFDRTLMPHLRVRLEILRTESAETIREAIGAAEGFHIVIWSSHGVGGRVSSKIEGGGIVQAAKQLAASICDQHVPRMVILSACSSARLPSKGGDEALYRPLIDQGVEVVIAMRARASDAFSRRLLVHLLANLLGTPVPMSASRALLEARRQVAEEHGLVTTPVTREVTRAIAKANLFLPVVIARNDILFHAAAEYSDVRWPGLDSGPELAPTWATRYRRPARCQGRRDQLSEMLRWHQRGPGPVFLIHGPAGVGKSNLAAEFIHLVRSSFDAVVPVHIPAEGMSLMDFLAEVELQLRCVGEGSPGGRPLWDARLLPADHHHHLGSPSRESVQSCLQPLLHTLQHHRVLLLLDGIVAPWLAGAGDGAQVNRGEETGAGTVEAGLVEKGDISDLNETPDETREWYQGIREGILSGLEVQGESDKGLAPPSESWLEALVQISKGAQGTRSQVIIVHRGALAESPDPRFEALVTALALLPLSHESADHLLSSLLTVRRALSGRFSNPETLVLASLCGGVAARFPAFALYLASELCALTDPGAGAGRSEHALIRAAMSSFLEASERSHRLAPAHERRWSWYHPILKILFHWVPPGEFWVGATRDERHPCFFPRALPSEGPAQWARLDRGFWIAEVAVTDEHYETFTRFRRHPLPPAWRTLGVESDGRPVTEVAYADALAFCAWLTTVGLMPPGCNGFALPTEAQWERAARGTSGQPYPWGHEPPDMDRAWCGQDYDAWPARVGLRPDGISPVSCHDMVGNVWEWCRDIWRPDLATEAKPDGDRHLYRVARGASFHTLPEHAYCGARARFLVNERRKNLGFRLIVE